MSRETYMQAVLATKIDCAIGAVVTGIVLILEFIAIVENRHQGYDLSKAQKRWRIHLAGATFTAFVLFQLDGALTWYDWTGQDKSCRDIQIPHVLLYIIAKQFTYLFLYGEFNIVDD
jgi:hypothetical protein